MASANIKNIIFAVALLPMVTPDAAFSGTLPPPPVFIPPAVGTLGPVFVPAQVLSAGAKAVSDDATQGMQDKMHAATAFCGRISSNSYTVDCLGDALAKVAEGMPATGDYAEARDAVAQAAIKLRALAKANADPNLPRGYVRSTGADGQRSNSPLTPMRADTMAETNAAALAIIEEAQTILLRSAENSALRKVHYERIAQAIGSNKVLLRSA